MTTQYTDNYTHQMRGSFGTASPACKPQDMKHHGHGSAAHAAQSHCQERPSEQSLCLVLDMRPKRSCLRCGNSDTPQWRRGPDGKPSLCNACGISYGVAVKKEQQQREQYGPPRHCISVDFLLNSE
eukprot:TRINITY_DN5405_c0_g1_i2.p1 TRINITY_DN5405_c0_g1~~TRINITY_DN5405_c0_g1_i2.p1  ORF type:complete len:135 (+),score=5.97 TRINITY_DN5405_c0_g1_i2:30-407(+)